VLTCARHTAAIYDRGGMYRVGPLDGVVDVKWERKRDDMSMATVGVMGLTEECRTLLANLEPNRHELVIFRDTERVWEGPISHVEYLPDRVNIEARDVMYYAYRLIRRTAVDLSEVVPPTKVVQYMKDVLVREFARREAEDPPINVSPFITGFLSADDVETKRVKEAYSNTLFEEIDDIGRYAGCDYTVVGRRIILSDVHTVFYQTPAVSEADFLGDVVVTAYGLQHATFAAVTDGEGIFGTAGGPDPYYGHWEVLVTTEDEEGDEEAPDEADPAVLAEQAARSLRGMNPVPFLVRLPENSTLNPNGALSMADLVPGARVPLRATLAARTFTMMQKLDSMEVTESAGVAEKITVSLSQASESDVPSTGVLP
jgi:hypothetical protein